MSGLEKIVNPKYFSKFAASVICRVYPYANDAYFNTSCPDSCCSGLVTSMDTACCTSLQWNTGVYIGLSVPLFCCIASLLVGFIYCFSVIKPNTSTGKFLLSVNFWIWKTFFLFLVCILILATSTSNSRLRFPHFRNRVVSPESRTAQPAEVKDDPPSYNELYKKAMGSSTASEEPATIQYDAAGNLSQQNERDVRVQSPEPPPYLHHNVLAAPRLDTNIV
jgi:hypothetical protein